MHRILHSGGYSNLGARGKNFQKLMLSEKKRGLILACIFSRKIRVFSKKKKKVLGSISSLISLFFSQNQGALQKKKKVFASISSLISYFSPKIRVFSKKKGLCNEINTIHLQRPQKCPLNISAPPKIKNAHRGAVAPRLRTTGLKQA